MKKIKPKNYTEAKNFLCDCTDKRNCLVHYSMLKLYIRHGMIVDKAHEIFSFTQCKGLEKSEHFNTQKRNNSKNDFDKYL